MINNSLNFSFFDIELNSSNVFFSKSTTNAIETSSLGSCVGWGGLVSNLNCPPQISWCNCNLKTLPLKPSSPEPTDKQLYDALIKTKECKLIYDSFKSKRYLDFFGIDYSNSTASYNCSCEEFNNTNSYYYKSVKGMTFTGADVQTSSVFPYAKRKTYTSKGISGSAYPTIYGNKTVEEKLIPNDICSNTTIIGKYFPYYLEYSKTNATFWNTPVKTPLLRQAQTNLLLYQRIKILVHGDFSIKPGDIININFPTGENARIKQGRFAGKWMIHKIKRVINTQRHSMYLFLMRDGLSTNPNTDYEGIQFKKEIT